MIFEKVEHSRVAEAVVRQVETLVLDGTLRAGDRLPPERELAESLKVSRPTLREALGALEAAGLITAQQGGGTFVAAITGSVFSDPMVKLMARHEKARRDYLEFRAEIEPLAASLAATRAGAADRDILARIVAGMSEAHAAGHPTEEARLDVEFHLAIGDASHNVVMIQTLRSIYGLMVHGICHNRTMLFDHADSRQQLLAQHQAICQAIVAGDQHAAAARARAHIEYVASALDEVERAGSRKATAERRLNQFVSAQRADLKARKRSA